jgi:CheY-like chemotaxis protein
MGKADPAQVRILVVDDHALVLSTLTELLRAHGHRVLEATKGRDGLELARAERPDLILVDYHMPEMDGLAVVGALKSDAATRGIPTVAFTSGTAAEEPPGDRTDPRRPSQIVRFCQSGSGTLRARAASCREPSIGKPGQIRKRVALAVLYSI